MRLGNITGTKTTMSTALITLGAKDGIVINPMARQILGLTETRRVDFYLQGEDLYVGMLPQKLNDAGKDTNTEGKSVSKTGKFIHKGIHSYLADNEQGGTAVWKVLDETAIFDDVDDVTFNKIELFVKETPVAEVVAEVAPVNEAPAPVEEVEEVDSPIEAVPVPVEEVEEEDPRASIPSVDSTDDF